MFKRRRGYYGPNIISTRQTPGFYKRAAYSTSMSSRFRRGIMRRRFSRRGSTKQISTLIRAAAEKKFFDYSFAITASTSAGNMVSTGATILSISDIPQGTTDNQRIGDKATIHYIEFNIWFRAFYAQPDNSSTANATRFIMFQWKDDTDPTPGDILQNVGTPSSALVSCFNHDRKVKRRILLDITLNQWILLNSGTYYSPAVGGDPSTYKKYTINLRTSPIKINYQGSTTTGVNKVYLMGVLDQH